MESKFAHGFYTQDKELNLKNLEILGDFPAWLNGSILRTGPALYELRNQQLNHWFDGMAMLYKFTFENGKVHHACKFLESDSYSKARETGSLQVKEWGTDPCKNIFQKLKSYFLAPDITDNGNINIIKYGDVKLATSETPLPIELDENDLVTGAHAQYKDKLKGHIDPSHPHYDDDGNLYSYLLKYSRISKYQIYKLDPATMVRQVISTIETKTPAYMHSFGYTENYIILVEFPFVVSPLKMKFGNKSLIESYEWKPDLGSVIQLVEKKTGKVTKYKTDPFFAFHHVNAFEEDDYVHLDLVRFDDPGIIQALYVEKLRKSEPLNGSGKLHRISIDLNQQKVHRSTKLSDKLFELPRINYNRYNAKAYRYVYGAGNTVEGNWLDDLTKIDVETGEYKTWYHKNCYPGEPIFVERPNADAEDDGVLLSIVLDCNVNKSFLLVLNAKDMSEIGRALLPEILPMAFHGNFYPS